MGFPLKLPSDGAPRPVEKCHEHPTVLQAYSVFDSRKSLENVECGFGKGFTPLVDFPSDSSLLQTTAPVSQYLESLQCDRSQGITRSFSVGQICFQGYPALEERSQHQPPIASPALCNL